MADILIHGISIPRERDHLTITINADGTVQPLVDMYCPIIAHAIELPEHGDLILRDEAIRILERIRDHCENDDMSFALNWAAQVIRDMTAIVPASEEVADENP